MIDRTTRVHAYFLCFYIYSFHVCTCALSHLVFFACLFLVFLFFRSDPELQEQTRRTIKAVWMRKRDARLAEEKKARDLRKRLKMRRGQPLGTVGVGGEGDHFS